jgi:hypothetical protein
MDPLYKGCQGGGALNQKFAHCALEPEGKPVPAGRGYVRPHPGPLPQERENRRQS